MGTQVYEAPSDNNLVRTKYFTRDVASRVPQTANFSMKFSLCQKYQNLVLFEHFSCLLFNNYSMSARWI